MKLEIRHSGGTYAVEWLSLRELSASLPTEAFVITDENVYAAHPALFEGRQCLVLPPGEHQKSLETYTRILHWLADIPARRDSTLVAFGGGVIGDLVGFAAASYMRGIRLLQVPTTLLAQVDSSVGGKVGIDLPAGKNLVGAFYPPHHVFIAPEVLRTLPPRQFTNGMAEVWKYGFIRDAAFVDNLEQSPTHAKSENLAQIIETCVRHKAEVVEADEFEQLGIRATLNFGHTIGHALEKLDGYAHILHGEAIAVGMVVEAELGQRLGVTTAGTRDRVEQCLRAQGLPTSHPLTREVEAMLAAMGADKKADRSGLAFSLLTEIGGCKLVRGVPESDVRALLNSL